MIKKSLLSIALCLLPVSASTQQKQNLTDIQCMSANLFFEARGEGYDGMKAVATVTMNRTKSKKYPKSVCAVVFQKKQFSWTHQKSWGSIEKILHGEVQHLKSSDLKAYRIAKKVAEDAIYAKLRHPKVKNSMYYHTVHVNPKWSGRMQKVAKIGVHVFYRSV